VVRLKEKLLKIAARKVATAKNYNSWLFITVDPAVIVDERLIAFGL
jgi:hypothetical protein